MPPFSGASAVRAAVARWTTLANITVPITGYAAKLHLLAVSAVLLGKWRPRSLSGSTRPCWRVRFTSANEQLKALDPASWVFGGIGLKRFLPGSLPLSGQEIQRYVNSVKSPVQVRLV